MNGDTANRIVKKLCALAGIAKRITYHSFRHSIASHLALNGATEIQIKAFLRHSRNTDTSRYVHMTMQDISDIYHSSINDMVDKKPDTPTQIQKPQEIMDQVPELDSRDLYKKLV
ncbi:MAG: tyrosine-type recombinase/integrase, partial [Thermoplasmata archaeon]|nr:tyrosine-type recombinase/integrase [Thermoplasmata archaeon]